MCLLWIFLTLCCRSVCAVCFILKIHSIHNRELKPRPFLFPSWTWFDQIFVWQWRETECIDPVWIVSWITWCLSSRWTFTRTCNFNTVEQLTELSQNCSCQNKQIYSDVLLVHDLFWPSGLHVGSGAVLMRPCCSLSWTLNYNKLTNKNKVPWGPLEWAGLQLCTSSFIGSSGITLKTCFCVLSPSMKLNNIVLQHLS